MVLRSIDGSTKGTVYEIRNVEELPEGYQGDYRMLMYNEGGKLRVISMAFVGVPGLFPYDKYEVVENA
jgi:hypothetical protein